MHSVTSYIAKTFPQSLRSPEGNLPYPYLDPGAGYEKICWDWDAFFCAAGLAPWADQVAAHVEGCVRNFLAFQGDDGSVPYALMPQSERRARRDPEGPANSAKPLLAQFAVMAMQYGGSQDLGRDLYEGLTRHVQHWEATQLSRRGLFTFRSHRGSGSDNHPAVYGRPFNSSADVFLNALMVAEYRALAQIADAAKWTAKADQLADTMRRLMWDPIDGMFYNLDVGEQSPGKVNQEVTWVVPLKFRAWTAMMPLWDGVADKAQAERVVREHLLNPDELWSDHGVRSLARNEPAYNIFVGGNPSDWQGPVWVVSNYLVYRGLKNYGYDAEARELAGNLLRMLAADIARNGCLHEYYDPETGQGLTHPGFMNWNTLAAVIAMETA